MNDEEMFECRKCLNDEEMFECLGNGLIFRQ